MNSISQDLFYKIRSRFTGLKLGKETGEITIDPSEAAFFDFDYMDGQNPIGHVSISLAEPANMKVYYSTGITEGMDIAQREGWYNFLKELRQFAKRRLMSFDTRDIAKDNLDKRDYQFLVQNAQQAKTTTVGESIMSESSMYGTSRTSFQKLMDTRLIIKHSKAVMDDSQPGARARNISALFVENQEGERFKYPFIHLSGARAMQRHVANGGLPYDEIGESIIKMSEEIAQLKSFGNYVVRNDLMNSDTNGIVERSSMALDNLRETLAKLSKQGYYEQYKENFHAGAQLEVPQDVVEDFTEKFTVKNFKEDIKSVFPILYRLMKEQEQSTEIGYDDIVEMTETQEEIAEEDFEAVASDPFTKFEQWVNGLGEASAIQSHDEDEKAQAVKELQALFVNPLPAGVDGTNAIESLNGIIDDPELEAGIKAVAKDDPETDVREMVKGWLDNNASDIAGEFQVAGAEQDVEDPEAYANAAADADAVAYGQQGESMDEAKKALANDIDLEYEIDTAKAAFQVSPEGKVVVTKVFAGNTDITKILSPEDLANMAEEIDPADFGPDDEKVSYDHYVPVTLHVEYDIFGSYRPATWGYHGGEPAEYPEIDEMNVYAQGESGEMVEISTDDLGPKASEWIEEKIWANEDSRKDDYDDYDDRDYDYESADPEQQQPKQSMNVQEVAQFIHSFYDKQTNSFPKGPEGVCTMVGKKFGEQAEQIARKFVERMAPHQATEQNPELAELARIKKLSGM